MVTNTCVVGIYCSIYLGVYKPMEKRLRLHVISNSDLQKSQANRPWLHRKKGGLYKGCQPNPWFGKGIVLQAFDPATEKGLGAEERTPARCILGGSWKSDGCGGSPSRWKLGPSKSPLKSSASQTQTDGQLGGEEHLCSRYGFM